MMTKVTLFLFLVLTLWIKNTSPPQVLRHTQPSSPSHLGTSYHNHIFQQPPLVFVHAAPFLIITTCHPTPTQQHTLFPILNILSSTFSSTPPLFYFPHIPHTHSVPLTSYPHFLHSRSPHQQHPFTPSPLPILLFFPNTHIIILSFSTNDQTVHMPVSQLWSSFLFIASAQLTTTTTTTTTHSPHFSKGYSFARNTLVCWLLCTAHAHIYGLVTQRKYHNNNKQAPHGAFISCKIYIYILLSYWYNTLINHVGSENMRCVIFSLIWLLVLRLLIRRS